MGSQHPASYDSALSTSAEEDESGFLRETLQFQDWMKKKGGAYIEERLCSRGGTECALGRLVNGALNDTLSGSEIVKGLGTAVGGIVGGFYGGAFGEAIGSLVGSEIGGALGSTPLGDVVGTVASTAKKVGDFIVSAPISVIGSLF